MTVEWGTPVGWTGTREEIAATYGGGTFGGMETSARGPFVLLFTDPEVGRQNGYEFDGWIDDSYSLFTYTGMGRRGPQKIQKGNLYTRDHRQRGLTIRLFGSDGYLPNSGIKRRIYLGEFAVDEAMEPSTEEAPGLTM
jgi:hypothetical protein